MTAYRTKPRIGTTQSWEQIPKAGDDQPGCILMLLGTAISYIVLSAALDVLSDSASKRDKLICYGSLLVCVALILLGTRDMYRDYKVRKAETREWKASCTVAQVEIIDRHPGGTYDDGYRFRSYPCRLEIEMNADQRAVSPHQTTVSVDVSHYIYDKLAERASVRVYYLPEAPLAFLLEEEM
jgi:hypothetical protein